jgi:1-acyl-sn-glycerol-3-phosphate acyltransferase
MNKILSWFCYIFLKPIFGWIFIKEVKGKENIPKGSFILVSNHLSYLDIFCDCYILLPRRFSFIGQIDGFKGFLKKFIRSAYAFFGVIPLDRNDPLSREEALKRAIEVLERGDILVVYPEGRRSRTGELQEGKSGVAKIFLKTYAPILPAGIKGTFELMPPGKSFPLIKKIIKINIGKPVIFEEEFKRAQFLKEDSQAYQEILNEISQKVMEELKNLINI